MQIIVMGTGGFAVPSFRRLIEADHEIPALVTMPLKYQGNRPIITPMRAVAMEYDIPIYDPEDVNTQESFDLLYLLAAQVLFVCDYGRILSPQILKTTPNMGLNLHGSLLPKYRGAAPINRAILAGEKFTGVSIIHMIPEVDAGPVVARSPSIPILNTETAEDVEEKLAVVGSWLVVQTIAQLETGRLPAVPQNLREGLCKAPKLKREEGLIDWNLSAEEIRDHVRALISWPKSYTFWIRNKDADRSPDPLRLILGRVEVLPDPEGGDCAEISPEIVSAMKGENFSPGTIIYSKGNQLILKTGNGFLRVLRIQPAGKGMMDAVDFNNGYKIQIGERFENPRV